MLVSAVHCLKRVSGFERADIHVGNVPTRPHNDSESPIIGDIGKGVAKTVPSSVQDAQLQNIVENWSTLPEHIKLAIQSLIDSVGEIS